ncbi:MAG: 1-(5-phosphoribosyl)-5-[(5-phosphoribosylamino)methylideneamino] imidazole-4-carboxamide isomerase [Pseudomonadota bacterium]
MSTSILMIPAIDLKNGHCVRLKQGDMNQATVFSKDPSAMAAHWVAQGARRLHVVDLDGAFAGKSSNIEAIEAILSAVGTKIPVQLGGGIRTLSAIEGWLKLGLTDVIIGTAAVKNPTFLREACREFEGHIMVGIDAKDGYVATDGWATILDMTALELAKQCEGLGVNSIVYTDIGRDGMMGGVNVSATQALAEAVNIPIIASGGMHVLQDVKDLYATRCKGIAGAILGRSIYEGTIVLSEAQSWLDAQVV